MKKIYLLCLLLSIPLLSLAQSNYKAGFIVNLKGDTLRGYIDYKEWGNSPDHISFKSTADTQPQRFTNKNIAAFSINGLEDYESRFVKISLDQVDLKSISANIDTTFKTDTIFLKVLEKGNYITLLLFRDNIKPRFYIQDNRTNVIQELVYKLRFSNNDYSKTLIPTDGFRSQLIAATQACHRDAPGLTQQILQSEYDQKDLIKIVAKINDKEISATMQKTSGASSIRFYAGIGVNVANLKFQDNYILGQSPTTKFTPGPAISAGFDFLPNPSIGKLFVRVDLSASQAKYNLSVNNGNINGTPAAESLSINHLTASLSPKVMYNFYNGDSFKAFFGAGFGFDLNFYPTDATTTTYEFTSIDYYSAKTTNDPQLNLFLFSANANAGVIVNKKIEINTIYILPLKITVNGAPTGSVSGFQVGVNYLFGK